MNFKKKLEIFLTCALTCTVLITISFETNVKKYVKINQSSGGVMLNKIISYSLEKQIALDRKVITCEQDVDVVIKGRNRRGNDAWNYTREEDEDDWHHVVDSNVILYSAFYDSRLGKHNYVRIVAMAQGILNVQLYCQLWSSKDQQPFVTEARISSIWSDTWGPIDSNLYNNPILISCLTSNNLELPEFVSITTKPCMKIESYKKIHQRLDKVERNFTVCVKNMNYDSDISQQLLQWLELHRLLGVESVYLYVEKVVPRVQQLIDKYSKVVNQKNFEVITKTVPKNLNEINEQSFHQNDLKHVWQRRRNHLITYNDCFYHNIHASRFVVPIDLDEIIIPHFHNTWNDLIDDILSKENISNTYASFMVSNTYFFNQKINKTETEKIKNSSRKLCKSSNKMLNKNNFNEIYEPFHRFYRSHFSANGESGKSFISTKNSLTIFNHYTLKSLKPGIQTTFFIPSHLAQMNHYRDQCDLNILPECVQYVHDKIIDRTLFKYLDKMDENLCEILPQL